MKKIVAVAGMLLFSPLKAEAEYILNAQNQEVMEKTEDKAYDSYGKGIRSINFGDKFKQLARALFYLNVVIFLNLSLFVMTCFFIYAVMF